MRVQGRADRGWEVSAAPTNTLANRNGNGHIPVHRPTGPLAILELRRDSIAGLMGGKKPEDVDRYIRSTAFAIARTPKLMECTPGSLIECACTGAELALDFTPSLGLAYMVPYNVKVKVKDANGREFEKWESRAQFQIGYRGLVTLALRANCVRAVEAHCVYARDFFEHEMGTDPRIIHRRPKFGEDRGILVGAYAIATMPDGTKQADVMDAQEIQAIRDRSKSKDSGPWKTDPGEMSKKTVVKRLCKYLNLSPAIGKALEADNEDTQLEVIDEAPRVTNTSRLGAALGMHTEADEPHPPIDQPEPPAPDPTQPEPAPKPARTEYVEIKESDIPF